MTAKGKETALRSFQGDAYRAHDLLWLKPGALSGKRGLPEWVAAFWTDDMPVVVRRDFSADGLIPVGIRGRKRSERAATWISRQDVVRKLSPEDIIDSLRFMEDVPFSGMKPVKALQMLLETGWEAVWGVTGSCAFALATGLAVMHDESDLDLLVRCPEPVPKTHFSEVSEILERLPCRTDIQVEVPAGAFSLKEWLREGTGRVLLKTNQGPVLTVAPWQMKPLERQVDG